jgi:hypothetical protein
MVFLDSGGGLLIGNGGAGTFSWTVPWVLDDSMPRVELALLPGPSLASIRFDGAA